MTSTTLSKSNNNDGIQEISFLQKYGIALFLGILAIIFVYYVRSSLPFCRVARHCDPEAVNTLRDHRICKQCLSLNVRLFCLEFFVAPQEVWGQRDFGRLSPIAIADFCTKGRVQNRPSMEMHVSSDHAIADAENIKRLSHVVLILDFLCLHPAMVFDRVKRCR